MRISDWSSDVCSSDLGGPNWRVPVPYLPTGGLRRFRKGKAADIKGQRPAIAVGKVFETRHRRALKALRNHLIEREQATLARARRVRESNRWRIEPRGDRKSVGEGKSVSVRVDLGGRRLIKKKKQKNKR